ncbi:uncharacterized protein LOC132390543 [Hypanus sabinus]|uniref:uncharacterized protein LOC132390543 n=1 Tax=Hypanus sabinus TaxID=79690 RepID=UPI0028C3F532|nr:uncharacterized protein LOC132390543 [Hypanus sabinus]
MDADCWRPAPGSANTDAIAASVSLRRKFPGRAAGRVKYLLPGRLPARATGRAGLLPGSRGRAARRPAAAESPPGRQVAPVAGAMWEDSRRALPPAVVRAEGARGVARRRGRFQGAIGRPPLRNKRAAVPCAGQTGARPIGSNPTRTAGGAVRGVARSGGSIPPNIHLIGVGWSPVGILIYSGVQNRGAARRRAPNLEDHRLSFSGPRFGLKSAAPVEMHSRGVVY